MMNKEPDGDVREASFFFSLSAPLISVAKETGQRCPDWRSEVMGDVQEMVV